MRLLVGILVLGLTQISWSDDTQLRVCFWNVESGGASSNVNKARIAGESGVDIWGLSEVQGSTDAAKYLIGAAEGESAAFESVLGTTGSSDRLQIIFNADKLELVSSEELHDINIGGSVRSPLVATFKLVGSDQQFIFMVNHLYRSNNTARHTQARRLNNWAEEQDLPIISGGDFNFDWHYLTGDTNHDAGFDLLVEDGVFSWVRPDPPLVPTNSSSHKSVLDFVFVSGEAMTWPATSTILQKPGEWPDGSVRSDHRPVDCVFSLTGGINSLRAVEPMRMTASNAKELVDSDPALAPREGQDRMRMRQGSEGNDTLLRRLEELEKEVAQLRQQIANRDER